jgi:hypothetical protein
MGPGPTAVCQDFGGDDLWERWRPPRGLGVTERDGAQAAVQPLQIDASLDADVVFHEYGHGLTCG